MRGKNNFFTAYYFGLCDVKLSSMATHVRYIFFLCIEHSDQHASNCTKYRMLMFQSMSANSHCLKIGLIFSGI